MRFLDWLRRPFGRSRRIEMKLDQILANQEILMANLKNLQDAVTNISTVEASAVTLIQGIAAELKAAGGDQAAVDALADQLNAKAAELSAAVAANTSAAPAPAPAGG